MFVYKKYIDCLPYNGRIGIIIPNGVLENPSKDKFRKYLISNLKIESIISLNKYVFCSIY
ncbi:N-6 DNA methylase [Clostridium perfringens]|nr:N-6 DNA methylase [Clostridium perfringens]